MSRLTCRWDYVVKHDVQLPDEYDEIHHDLEPFWGIDPLLLQKTREELETQDHVVVVEKTAENPYIEIVHRKLPPANEEKLTERIWNILLLLEGVEDFLPPFRAVFSPHDNPSMLSDYGVRSMAIAAAATGSSEFFLDIVVTCHDFRLMMPSSQPRGITHSAAVWLALGLPSIFSSLAISHQP
jgi:hypothetical protein